MLRIMLAGAAAVGSVAGMAPLHAQAEGSAQAAMQCDARLAVRVTDAARGLAKKYDPEIAGDIRAIAAACPDDADIQLGYAATLYHAAGTVSDADQKIDVYALLWDQLTLLDGMSTAPKDYQSLSFLNKSLVLLLSELAAASNGKTIPAFANAEPLLGCPRSATATAQEMWYPHLSRSRWTAYSPLFLRKLAEACKSEPGDLGRMAVVFYSEYLMEQAQAVGTPEQKLALADEAVGWVVPSPKAPTANKASIDKIMRQKAVLEAELGASPDFAQRAFWEGSDQLDEYRRAAIGYRADALWGVYLAMDKATTSQEEQRAAMRAYRDFVVMLETSAKDAGPQATKLVYEGLDGHADEIYRSDAFKGRTPPPYLLRHLTDPNRESQ